MKYAMQTIRCLGGAFALLVIGVLLVGTAEARQAWDQAAVTSLAADLAKATRDLENTLRREPQLADAALMGDRNSIGLWEAIDGLERSARQLASRAKAGKGYEETLPIAQKIRTLVRDAEQYGAGIMTTAFMEEKIAPVEELLKRLEPYYF
jgi:hypothetical protein